jgi:hypothetical protein
MVDKILPITFQKMDNLSHNALMHHVEELLESENLASHGFEKHIEDFKLALTAEVAAGRVRRKSSLTREMVNINAKREELYAGLLYHYESSLRHYDETMRQAAEGISHIMKSIAYIHNTSNEIRYAYIKKITNNIRLPKYAANVETLQLQGWLDALDTLNELYRTNGINRTNEHLNQGDGNVRSKRIITDKVFQGILKRLNALIVIEGPEEYTHFVGRLNTHIAREKQSMAIREGWRRHKKEKKAKEAKETGEAPEAGVE